MTPGSRGLASSVLVVLWLAGCGRKDAGTPAAPGTQPAATTTTTTTMYAVPAASKTCERQGYVDGKGIDCRRTVPTFLGTLDEAIETVARQHPQLVDRGHQSGPDGYRVLNDGLFYRALITELDRRGICADFDGAEVALKTSNAFNDQYQVITSFGYLRRGDASYRSTCTPTAFPTPPPPPFPESRLCGLAPSRDYACQRDRASFQADVEASIDQVIKEHPEVFDFNKYRPGTDWYLITNHEIYTRLVVEAMQKRGRCARYDGAELAVKSVNDFSDQYDISAGDAEGNPFIRRGEGSYRSSCYPAAF